MVDRLSKIIPGVGDIPGDREPSLLVSSWEPKSGGAETFSSSAAIEAFQVLISGYVTSVEANDDRHEKMGRNVEHQLDALETVLGHGVDPRQVIHDWTDNAEPEDKIGLLVEVLYLDPFAPNEVEHSNRTRQQAFDLLDEMFGFDPRFEQIKEVAGQATGAHQQRNWAKVGLIGVGAAALLAVGGYVAAPFLGAALGAAAGLSGAAATAHGLALLGGGALAAGGAGMAGGMWLVAGALGAAGAMAGAGGVALYQLGAAAATRELIKLQVTFKLAILHVEADMVKAQLVLKRLHAELDLTKEVLDEALLVNDQNSKRIKDIQETVTALENAIDWMEDAELEVA